MSGSGSKYTSLHKSEKIVYLEEYEDLEEARRREKQIKGWTRNEGLLGAKPRGIKPS